MCECAALEHWVSGFTEMKRQRLQMKKSWRRPGWAQREQ